jgi:hypothetical protein
MTKKAKRKEKLQQKEGPVGVYRDFTEVNNPRIRAYNRLRTIENIKVVHGINTVVEYLERIPPAGLKDLAEIKLDEVRDKEAVQREIKTLAVEFSELPGGYYHEDTAS